MPNQDTLTRWNQEIITQICRVACLNGDRLQSHCREEDHKKRVEETFSGPRFGKNFCRLQDYIACPWRREPLIGLQYIIQLFPEDDHPDAFKCTLCKKIGSLFFIISHLRSFNHRIRYLSKMYEHLFPLYSKHLSFNVKKRIVKTRSAEVEHQERALDFDVRKSCTSRVGVKNDFWKYNVKMQEKLEDSKKLSAYEAKKENILKYMEAFVIASSEEAALAQNFAEDLEAAVDVFCLNTKSRHDYVSKYEREKNLESKERKYKRHSGILEKNREQKPKHARAVLPKPKHEVNPDPKSKPEHRDYKSSKRRSVWNENEPIQSPSTYSCKDTVVHRSDELSAKKEPGTKKQARNASTDILPMFTFSIGSESNPSASGSQQEQHVPFATSSVTEQSILSSENLDETIEKICRTTEVSWGVSQEYRSKRFKQNSTDIAKWESLFTDHHPRMTDFKFSWGNKSPSFNNSEISSADEKKIKNRRASLEALSTFTLFSSNSQLGSATSPFLSKFKTAHRVCEEKGDRHDEANDQESPSSASSNLVNFNVTMTHISNDIPMPSDPEQHDGECNPIHRVSINTGLVEDFDKPIKPHQNSDFKINHDDSSNMNADVARTDRSNQEHSTHSVQNSDLETCVSGHSGTKTDTHDSPSSSSDSTSPSSRSHDSGRHLSPEVLQLFKGKDTDSIIRILRTLTPFYPALKELNLEIFAEVLSETGAIH
ncbi:uncharacterized protein LOC142158671 isoform X2 [Mixophyes fleayi]|uniref:uncharacterized protein LOC142158671 isoform X2 n=1 Tax=Mixophyes fleayi TaxID=3061075 RepID=UPI003F4DC710